MKIVLFIYFFLKLLHISRSQGLQDEDLDIAIFSAVGDKKAVTASGTPEIGVKLGDVTLQKFSHLSTQIWTLIRIDSEDAEMVVELIAKDNEQNTLTSYIHKGAHSYNQWELYMMPLKGKTYFQMHNQRNSKCLNNKDGNLFYSTCDDSAMSQMWDLKQIA